jgi:hypothetical protein
MVTQMRESLRPLFERFLLWADECPDVRAAIIEWPEHRMEHSERSPDVHITVITGNSRQQLSTT